MDRLETLAGKIPGLLVGGRWNELRAVLNEIAPSLPASGDFVEVGCFAGQSTVLLADFAAGRKVWAVDLFPHTRDWEAGAVMTDVGEEVPLYPHGREDRAAGGIDLARNMVRQHAPDGSQLQWFLANVGEAGYGDVIKPFRGTARQFSRFMDGGSGYLCAALVFLDADHAYEAVRADIAAIEPLLIPGAALVLDDMDFDGVKRAADEVLTEDRGYSTRMLHGYLVAVKR